ncbi:uncharacterized protein LOC117176366 [Belonocnema kinseyi]|uniref:uncharacterized protein LOC117176366 n=1 Tax=Belonocnema kinseyi TaxID=2817044 RepID=UPI00143D6C4C|nr:uncharacterized protein LOC117176366 [Belonocnema kinseyi]
MSEKFQESAVDLKGAAEEDCAIFDRNNGIFNSTEKDESSELSAHEIVKGNHLVDVVNSADIDLHGYKIIDENSTNKNIIEESGNNSTHPFDPEHPEDIGNSQNREPPEEPAEDHYEIEMEDDCEFDKMITDRSYLPDSIEEENNEDDSKWDDTEKTLEEDATENERSKKNKSFSSLFTTSGKSAISEVGLVPDLSKCKKGQSFMLYPAKSKERGKLIDAIRKKGDAVYNSDADYNKGNLITVRRVQLGQTKTAADFENCPECDGSYAKSNIRHHYPKCTGRPPTSSRTLLQEARRKVQRFHQDAYSKMRSRILTILNAGEISAVIRYDRLIILHGNLMSVRHKEHHQDVLISATLRLGARFLVTLRSVEKNVVDLASAFNPTLFEKVMMAINIVGEFNEEKQTYNKPSNASNLGTVLRKCGEILIMEYIISQEKTKKECVEDFLIVFKGKFGVYVNKNVAETFKNRKKEKRVELPSVRGIKKKYSYQSSVRVSELVLLQLLVFKRRRSREI